MQVYIRQEISSDLTKIRTLIATAFKYANHTRNTEQFIVDALRTSGNLTISLVAEVEGIIVGHIALSPVHISDGSLGWYGLAPLAVAPKYQGKTIGSQLIKQALLNLRELGADGCVVLGEPSYYSRFNFQAEPSLILPNVPPAYFLALALKGKIPKGIVSYHQSFNVQG